MTDLTPIGIAFDDGLARQPELRSRLSRTLDLRTEADRVRLMCRSSAAEAVKQRLREARAELPGPWLAFLGSGDFHHVTLMLLEEFAAARGPFSLVLIDNHPDWTTLPPKYHCGNWVAGASRLAQTLTLIGMDSPDLRWNALYAAPIRAMAQDRIRMHPWRVEEVRLPGRWTAASGGCVTSRLWGSRIRFSTCTSLGTRRLFQSVVEGLPGERIYLSIDKDVLRADDVPADWEQGRMTLCELVEGVALLADRCTLLGADVCGDRGTSPLRGLVRRVDAGRWRGPWRQPSAEEMRKSELANLAILDALTPMPRDASAALGKECQAWTTGHG